MEKMNYEEFKNALKEAAELILSKDLGQNVSINFVPVTKNNHNYDGAIFKLENNSVSPSINVEKLFELYKEGTSFNAVINSMSNNVLEAFKNAPKIIKDTDKAFTFDYCKDNLIACVINTESNKALLKTHPHRELMDMSVVYRVCVDKNDGDFTSTFIVTNDLLKSWGKTEEDLYNIAQKTTEKVSKSFFKGMSEILLEYAPEMADFFQEEDIMYVLGNEMKVHGAGLLAVYSCLEKIAEKLGEDYYVLPSSIHEVIIIPDSKAVGQSIEEMKAIVTEVNSTEVLPEEKLTDNVYHYDAKMKLLETSDEFLERTEEAREI